MKSPRSVRTIKTACPSAPVVDHHRHPHRATRQALLGEHLALEELVVLTVAVAVLGQVPAIHHPPMVLVRERLDRRVDMPVDGIDRVPGRLRETNDRWLRRVGGAFAPMPVAEIGPGPQRRGWLESRELIRAREAAGPLLPALGLGPRTGPDERCRNERQERREAEPS